MQYLMQKLITVAGAIGVPAYGAWWRAPDRGLVATPDNTEDAALRGRAIGFKGSFCVLEDQVAPINQGFTPSAQEVAEAGKLLESYRAAVSEGSASIRQGDRIIDSGTALQAQALIDRSEACEAHDKAKIGALAGRPVPAP
jgi:citrate lyase subunit beta/citryl-CoA lyase